MLPDASYLYFELFCNRDYYDEDLNLQIERDGDLDCLNTVIKMREEGLDMNVDMWGTEATAAYGDGSLVSVCTGGWFGGFLKTDYAPDAAGKWGVAKMPGGVKASNWGRIFPGNSGTEQKQSSCMGICEIYAGNKRRTE